MEAIDNNPYYTGLWQEPSLNMCTCATAASLDEGAHVMHVTHCQDHVITFGLALQFWEVVWAELHPWVGKHGVAEKIVLADIVVILPIP